MRDEAEDDAPADMARRPPRERKSTPKTWRRDPTEEQTEDMREDAEEQAEGMAPRYTEDVETRLACLGRRER